MGALYTNSLIRLIETEHVERMAEIGVYHGRNLRTILKKFPDQIIAYWGIDPYEQLTQDSTKKWYKPKSYWDNLFYQASKYQMYFKSLRILRFRSDVAASFFEPCSLDLVFIDGNHDYDHVREDILLWEPKIKPGGILCGHDYGSKKHIGVKKAVDEHFGINFLVMGGGVWVTDTH